MASSLVILFFIIASLFILPCFASVGTKERREVVEVMRKSEAENNEVCSSGKTQSPIDINTSEALINKTLQPLNGNYHVFNASLISDGKHLQVAGNVEGGLKIEGKSYNFKQMHWHTPSEHRLNAVQYAAELHQVHTAADGSITVVGILFKDGPPNPLLTMLKPELEEVAKNISCEGGQENASIPIPRFDSSFLRKRPRQYYTYMGSLTTPPCTQNVLWNLLAKVKTISKDQVALLKATVCVAYKENARPTQPLNGRTVQKYDGN